MTTISPAELHERLSSADGPLLVDVRTGAEYESAHIQGSTLVPLDRLPEFCAALRGLDRDVVLVCQSGARAAQAEELLGDGACAVLDGGMRDWQASGYDVVEGSPKWALDRQVRLVASSMVVAGIALSGRHPRAKWLSGAVGLGLFHSAVTDSCAMAALLSKLPYNRGDVDVDGNVASLLAA